MNISRRGSYKNYGYKTLVSDLSFRVGNKYKFLDDVQWKEADEVLLIKSKFVPHSDGVSHHNYEIVLTLEDISTLIEIVGHAASTTSADLLRDNLSEQIPAIVKLLACATGVAPVPIDDDS